MGRYVGDGAIAYFGYPQAHEDDAERAVRAGLELVKTVPKLQPRPNVALEVRVGIASGTVVVEDLTDRKFGPEEEVVGDTPALAARLQALAEHGTVVISERTRRLVGGLFALSDLGPNRIKGFAQPLSVWRVLGESWARSRFEALRGQSLTPLIGRAHEIDLLLERWARSTDGEGQVVLLEGEAGIGKSRLVSELRERLSGVGG